MSEELENNILFFDPVVLGKSLKEVSADIIKTKEQNVLNRWFHSPNDVDLFIWSDEKNNIIKQQVIFCGQVIEWNIIDGVKTGFILEDDLADKIDKANKINKSDIIQFDTEVQKSTITQGLEIIQNIPELNDSDRASIQGNFAHSPQMSKMDPDEFLKRYGNPESSSRKRWVRKLLFYINKFLG